MTTEPAGAIPLRERRTVADEYKEFADVVLPGPKYETFIRMAFYAGASAMFRMLPDNLDVGDEAMTLDVSYMSVLDAELCRFARDVAEGRG